MSKLENEEAVFNAALDLPDGEARTSYLNEACACDAAFRQRIELLLSAYGEGQHLCSPPADLATTALLPAIGERPGDHIGPYKLLEQIGEGGMGLVFMAEQIRPLRRRVALKIIKPGLDTRAIIARFEAERQALALMDHPNIARVYDAGATESGRPYFVMELVRGAPITDYCREEKLVLRQRLELFLDVCQAVQHAHQKGVIHRDLKPTNILVTQNDTAPVPKVIDFGVAKATAQQLTERTLFTGYAQIIGTPLYMSPEQADLRNQDVDTRSDVYSLGVVLYELLTGATPFDAVRLRSAGPDEMRRIIREEEPPKPSTRATTAAAALSTVATRPLARGAINISALRGDLDWIVMKALEKDRRRRYESPSALAADIARHLGNQPVEAYPPTRRYQLWKFARRNRAMLLTTGAIAVTLLLGIGVSVWQAMRARESEQRATKALATAEAHLKTARQAVDEMYTQVAEKWLFKEGQLTPVQREFLQKAIAYYQSFASVHSDTPLGQFDVGVALRRQAFLLDNLGDAAEADVAYRKSIDQLDSALPGLPDPVLGRYELGVSLGHFGRMMRMARRYDEAVPPLNRAISLLEEVVASVPLNPKYRRELGRSTVTLAGVYLDQDRNEEAQRDLLRCREHFGALLAQEPENAWNACDLGVAEQSLAKVLTNLGRHKDAKPLYLRAIELQRRAVESDRAESFFRYHLANALQAASANDAVKDHLPYDREAYEISRDLVQQHPDRPRYLETFLVNQTNLVITLEDHDRKEMLTVARTGLDVARRLKKFPGNPDYHEQFVRSLLGLHSALLANQLFQEAAEFYPKAIDEVRADPECRQLLGYLMKCIATDTYSFGQPKLAIPLMQECLAVDASQAGPTAYVVLALAHAEIGEMEIAHTWLAKATPLPEPQPKSDLTGFLYRRAVKTFDLKAQPK
jgi:eukaryotic-like serine/threonine-protein kinase